MTDDLLSGGEDNTPHIDPNKDYLPELVGEGKKFKSPQDLARGKYEADMFIETLKRQQDDLRAEYMKLREESMARAKLEELVDRLGKAKPPESNPLTDVNLDNIKPNNNLDPTQLDELISSKMEAREESKRREQNYKRVETKLRETYGDNYARVLKEQMDELNLTKDYVNDLARRSPEAFFRTMGLQEQITKDPFRAPPRSSRISDNFNTKGSPKRTWSYYQDLKKSNPKVYFDPKTTTQMHKDYAELGKSFQDGDFEQFGDGL